MSFDFDTEVAKIIGKYVDYDYAPKHAPHQCHDVWLWLLYLLGGRPGDGYAPDDDTVSVFTRFPYRPRLAELFTKHEGTAGIRKGDVLFWRRGIWYPGSHVAIADGPVSGELVPAITQNPGPVRRANLITRDLVGYLRPVAFNPTPLGGLPMFAPYWTGPTPNSTRISGRVITDYGSFHVPTPQIMNLLNRRHTAALKPGMDNDNMLDAEHDILNSYLRSCFVSAQTGVQLDADRFLKAINEGFAKLGKSITVTADSVDIAPEDLLAALELAVPRIAAAMVKQAGEKLSS